MGFFDICNDDPDLTSGSHSTTQRGNNGRSYASDYNYSTFPSAPYTSLNGIYAYNNNPCHIFVIDGEKFGEFYVNSNCIKCKNFGKVVRYSNNAFIAYIDYPSECSEFSDYLYRDYEGFVKYFDVKTFSSHNEEIYIMTRNNELVCSFTAYAIDNVQKLKDFCNKATRYGYKGMCQKVAYSDVYKYQSYIVDNNLFRTFDNRYKGTITSVQRSSTQSADTTPHTFQITPKLPDFTGLYAFEKNIAHVFLFEAPDKFSEYYINSTGKRCVSIGKYGHLQNGCFLIQCDDVRKWSSIDELIATQENNPKECYSREIFISYTINFKDFFVAFKHRGDTTQERISNFVEFAGTHYNWEPLLKKRDYTLDDYEKMIIQKRLYVY